jgi:phosphatidate cytidylyltransferase
MAATGGIRQRKATDSETSRHRRRCSLDDDSEDANEAPQEDPLQSAMAFAKPDETKCDDKYAKMIRRSKLAVMMMVSFGLILWTGHMAIVVFVILLQTMLFYEVTDLTYKKRMEEKIPLFRSLHWIGYAISMFFTYGQTMMIYFDDFVGFLIPYHMYLVFCAYVPFFLAFVFCCASSQTAKDKDSRSQLLRYMFARLSWLLLIIFVIVFQCRFVMYNVLEGIFWFLLPTSLVIMNDTAAYFTGACSMSLQQLRGVIQGSALASGSSKGHSLCCPQIRPGRASWEE